MFDRGLPRVSWIVGGAEHILVISDCIAIQMTFLENLKASLLSKFRLDRQIAWDGIWSFVLRAISIGLGFLSTVLLARLLGAEGYGIYSYVFAWVMLLSILAQAGLPDLVVRETAQGIAQNRPD